jgi:hypothetical protein
VGIVEGVCEGSDILGRRLTALAKREATYNASRLREQIRHQVEKVRFRNRLAKDRWH